MSTEKVNKAVSSWRPKSGRESHEVQCMMGSWMLLIRSGMLFRFTKIRTFRWRPWSGTSCQDSRKALWRCEGWGCHMKSSLERDRSRGTWDWQGEWAMLLKEKWKETRSRSKNKKKKRQQVKKQTAVRVALSHNPSAWPHGASFSYGEVFSPQFQAP